MKAKRYKIKLSGNIANDNRFKAIIGKEIDSFVPQRYDHVRLKYNGIVYFVPKENFDIVENEDKASPNA
jgi:hypothetical protein